MCTFLVREDLELTPNAFWHECRAYLGIERNTTSHTEKCLSALGAFFGILAVFAISFWYLSDTGALLMLASMGASAVLLFAVPHGALSQPWALLGGHLLSAAVGVTCQALWPGQPWTPALAVGLAVGVMYYLRCIHPPGGATALAAVIGGASVHELGYHYLTTPVLANAYDTGICRPEEFRQWARFEVMESGGRWVKRDHSASVGPAE